MKRTTSRIAVPSHHDQQHPPENPLAHSRRGRPAVNDHKNDNEAEPDHTSDTASVASSRRQDRLARDASSLSAKTIRTIKADLAVELEHAVYYPGQVVRGVVKLEVHRPLNFYALRLRIAGKESMVIRKKKYAAEVLTDQTMTFWKMLFTLEGTTKTTQTLLGMKNKYAEQQLHGHTSAVRARLKCPTHMISPGFYTYPFEAQLPSDLPPSFEHFGEEEDYAAVIYYVKAYLDIPGGGDADLVARQYIRVVSRVGLPQWKAEAKPVAHHQSHEVSGCCGRSKGTVQVTVEIPRRLLSIGDDKVIPFRVVVNNQQGVEPVNRAIVQLVHVLNVRAGGEEEQRRTVLATHTETKRIEPGDIGGIMGELPMPPDPPPSLEGLLFESSYLLLVEADLPWALDPQTASAVTLVQRVEVEEAVAPHPLGRKGVDFVCGLHEFLYRCPADAAERFVPISCTASPGASPSWAFGEDSLEEQELVDVPPPIDYAQVSQKRPAKRWILVPPAHYD